MDPSTTASPGGGDFFPNTRWSLIRGAADPVAPERRASLEDLARVYWRPVYAYFRRKWGKSNEEAKDLTQELFVALTEKDFLQDLSPDQGKFRSYLMVALDNFVRYQHRHESRKKRGGGALRVSLDQLEGFEPSTNGTAEDVFLHEWARCTMADALRELEQEYRGKENATAWEVFRLRDVDPPASADEASYEALARRFKVRATDVTNYLFRARKRLRELVLNRVRDTVTSESEALGEMKELFEERPGAGPPG